MLSENQILQLRGPKQRLDPWKPFGIAHDQEPSPLNPTGHKTISTSTVFLTGKECVFRCLMCDLWQYTLDRPTPSGAIAKQLQTALDAIPHRQCIKLYNASNFFDPKAVPDQDLEDILEILLQFESVVVENHPKLTGRRLFDFAEKLEGRLQVAMGLETSNSAVLANLNKNMTTDDFRRACDQLKQRQINIRTFVIHQLPGVAAANAIDDICDTVSFAIDSGVDIISLIPLRSGNGAIDHLLAQQQITLPTFSKFLNAAFAGLELAIASGRILLVDLWDQPTNACNECFQTSLSAWQWANEHQLCPAISQCSKCGDSKFAVPC